MSKAIECDRCGRFTNRYDAFDISSERLLHRVKHDTHFPDSFDLCRDCGDSLNLMLVKWWRVCTREDSEDDTDTS